MRDKHIKLIFFSLRGSEVRDFDLSWKKLVLYTTMATIILIIFVGAVVGLLTNFYQTSRIITLQRTNQILKDQLGEMQVQIKKVTEQIEKIEALDDEQRLIAGLDKIDKDMRNAGRGGASNYEVMSKTSSLPRDTRKEISNIKIQVDQLERRIQLAVESKNEISQVLKNRKQRLQHLPTINPVQGGRITDKFGIRIDPFIEKPKLHTGVDIAAPTGTPVHAAAYGLVEVVHNRYQPNRNYGKYIIINHGFGKRTLYAHLSKIFVKQGQLVKRWDVIGAVGETGRATGPHLHYEVRENETPVNPLSYFFE